jgi:N-acetylglucosamine-6-phosphate deacetylase
MIVLSGAALVLPDRILAPGTLVIDNDRIAEIRPDAPSAGSHSHFAFHDHYIVPGFIDVHVHGTLGIDALDDRPSGDAVTAIAAQLPRYGVTAFCPTTVACEPTALRRVLDQVRRAREHPPAGAARVLPAHLESNFINPEYRGAQPPQCLRVPTEDSRSDGEFTAVDILREIERAAPDVGIVTVAPELDGGIELIRWLAARVARVSLGHSAATYDQALEAIGAGARHATHLFNRMPPLGHRTPGLAGAVLQNDEVAAEIICDGVHVHPAMVRTAVAAKRPTRMFAITDGTSVSGLPVGSRARLGSHTITAGSSAAVLDDGTLAGSILTMEGAFQTLCATTPARELGLVGHGVLAPDAVADLVVLDAMFSVVQTYIGGQLVYTRTQN